MTHASLKSLALGFALSVAALSPLLSTSAEAGGRGKEFFSETYITKQPLHGFEGRAGDYYCSYIRIPVHKIDKNGRMVVVAWKLEQNCS